VRVYWPVFHLKPALRVLLAFLQTQHAWAWAWQVEEFFIEKVYQIVYFKDMGIRSRKTAIEFAEAAVKHMYKGGLSVNSQQDTKGGIMLHRSAPPLFCPSCCR
jgi:hypothetical protein